MFSTYSEDEVPEGLDRERETFAPKFSDRPKLNWRNQLEGHPPIDVSHGRPQAGKQLPLKHDRQEKMKNLTMRIIISLNWVCNHLGRAKTITRSLLFHVGQMKTGLRDTVPDPGTCLGRQRGHT